MAILIHCPWPNAQVWLDRLRAALPDAEICVWPDLGAPGDIDFAMVWQLPAGVLSTLPNLKGVCSLGAGVDHFLSDPDMPRHLPVARLVDPLMADRMAEYVTGQVLRYHLRSDDYAAQQRQGVWERLPQKDAPARTVGILGLGHLGTVCAKQLSSLGFRTCGWSRSAKQVAGLETFHDADGLASMLRQTEILVCLLPLTTETRGILNAETFAQMPRGAALINVARGDHLVDADLLAALTSGQLRGATLDVFRDEPLPAAHAFWRHDKILVTPHISSLSEPATAAVILAEQYHRCRRGEPMRDLVDLSAGY